MGFDGGDLIECAICAACCYCCIKACEGQNKSSRRSEPQTVIVQHQPYPSGYPNYGPGAGQPYYQGAPGGYYPPQQGPGGPGYYPPPGNPQAYPYPPQHHAHPYPGSAASAPPPYDHTSRY